MFDLLLPRVVDNVFRGQLAALWLFGLVLLMRLGMSAGAIFAGRSVAVGADGIPLDSFPPRATQTVLALFALFALSRLVLSLIGIVALARYRALVPLLFAFLLLEHVARYLLLARLPIPRDGAPPAGAVNLVLLSAIAVGLVLSLWPRAAAAIDAG